MQLIKDHAVLKIGYYKGYSRNELFQAVALFSEKYPSVEIQFKMGSHEELYHAMEDHTSAGHFLIPITI